MSNGTPIINNPNIEEHNDRVYTLEDVISAAKDQLNIADTQEHDDYLENLAQEAMIHLGDMANTLVKLERFDIIDGTVCLPKGFIKLLGMGVYDETINPYNLTNVNYELGQGRGRDDFYIQNGWLVFNFPDRVEGNKVILLYQTRNLDCNGLYYIFDYQIRAVKAYLCFRYAQKFPERYMRDIRTEYRMEWTAQAAHCRSLTAKKNADENQHKINRIFNTWVNQRYTWFGYYWGYYYPNR
jgi:hypothetical protein